MKFNSVSDVEKAALKGTEKLFALDCVMQKLTQVSGAVTAELISLRAALHVAFAELQGENIPSTEGFPMEELPYTDFIPDTPVHNRPYYGRSDCTWICDPITMRARRVVDGYEIHSPNPVASAWYHHHFVEESDKRLIVGVSGNGGALSISEGYGGDRTIRARTGATIKLHVVGLDNAARVQINMIGAKYGYVEEFGTYDIGTEGYNSDSFIMRQKGAIGHFTRMGCWFIAFEGKEHSSGASMSHGFETCVWEDELWKGILFREHIFYWKPGGKML